MALTKAHNRIIADSSANIKDFGAVGDGVADDTTAVQAALDSGLFSVVIPDGTFLVNNLVVPNTVKLIYGSGTLKQKTLDTSNVITATSIDNLTIKDISIVGQAAGDFSVEAFNNGIYLTSCTNITVLNVKFYTLDNQPVYARTSAEIKVLGNHVEGCCAGVRFNGVENGVISDNNFIDCAVTDGNFVTCISLNSQSVSGGGQNFNVVISNNNIQGYKNAQGVLVHDGQRVRIIGNHVQDCTWGYSANPTDASDNCIDISIVGNTFIGSSSALGSETGEYGIFVGASTGTTKNITISSNVINGANATWKEVYEGGIGLGGGSEYTVTGNVISDTYSNGIVINQDNVSNCKISDNIIHNVIAGDNTARRGIAVSSTASTVTNALIKNNLIDGATVGVQVVNTQGTEVTAVENIFTNVTIDYTNVNYMVSGNYQVPYTDGDTTPSVKNAKVMRVLNSSATTITAFDDGVEGQIVTFYFEDGNTTINDSGNIRLTANFSSTTFDTLVLVKAGPNWAEISRAAN